MYVSRRGKQLQLFAREYRHARDVDDTNDDIIFSKGDARDDGDKLATLSTKGGRKGREEKSLEIHSSGSIRSKNIFALA